MLSRRDKLLVQPWAERRYRDHRAKVACASAAVDAGTPAARPHVALKLKKQQAEAERARRVRDHNYTLLQRLARVMAVTRVDNRWVKPLPNFQHKVGLYVSAETLDSRLSARAESEPAAAAHNVRCYACHLNKRKYELTAELAGERAQ